MNNVLNKLIELGYMPKDSYELMQDEYFIADIIKRALFDECGKRNLVFEVDNNILKIQTRKEHKLAIVIIYKGDTSRESFLQAFCKVVGI